MAKKKKEEPKVDNEVGKLKVKEKVEKQPDGNKTEGDVTKVKEKMKMKPIDMDTETITKVDLNKPEKPEENEVKEDNAADSGVVTELKDADTTQEQEKIQPEAETQETPTLEEITEESKTEETEEVATAAEEAIKESVETGKPLPENIQRLVDFMEDTGGDINDYVKLNQDYSEMDNNTLLQEYYKQTKPHLSGEEIDFLMEDQFSFDEDSDDEKEIKRKKLALKEQVANAKSQLEENKSKYYSEIKSGSKLTKEQQEAINFYNQSQKITQDTKVAHDNFLNKTNRFFGDKFKGFEYNVGDKRYRFNVSDANKTKETQSDINNFVGKFLDENNQLNDTAGYHKALYTAMNSDAIAKHFYEQGKADAIKDSIAKSKNIDMEPRQELTQNPDSGGIKVRALGDNTADFKFKIKNKK